MGSNEMVDEVNFFLATSEAASMSLPQYFQMQMVGDRTWPGVHWCVEFTNRFTLDMKSVPQFKSLFRALTAGWSAGAAAVLQTKKRQKSSNESHLNLGERTHDRRIHMKMSHVHVHP